MAEDDFEVLQQQAIQARLALEVPRSRHRRQRVAIAEGFSLHADTAVHANDRASHRTPQAGCFAHWLRRPTGWAVRNESIGMPCCRPLALPCCPYK